MTLVATYDQPNARVALVTTGLLTAGATIFSIQRAPTNSGPWTDIRGAADQVATTNSAQTWYDYEYDPGPDVTNYYRVISKTKAAFVAAGTVSQAYTGGPSTLTPGLPAGLATGDVMLMTVTQSVDCNNDDGVWPPVISGWTLVSTSPSSTMATALFMRVATASESAPTFNRVVNSGLLSVESAQIAAFRYVRPVVLNNAWRNTGQPASTTQVGFPALTALENHSMYVAIGLSADVWTSVAATASWTLISATASTDRTVSACTSASSIAWQYQSQSGAANISAGVMAITGGSHSLKNGATLALSYDPTNAPTSVLFSDDVDTPLDEVWLKDPLRPPRNMVVQVASPSQMKFVARSGLFDVKGRAEPIEISEIRRAMSWTQRWAFTTFDELDGLVELFAPGRTLLLHVPARGDLPDCPPWPRNLPGGYIYVGDVTEETGPDVAIPGTMTAPVQIVAAPDPGLDFLEDPVP